MDIKEPQGQMARWWNSYKKMILKWSTENADALSRMCVSSHGVGEGSSHKYCADASAVMPEMSNIPSSWGSSTSRLASSTGPIFILKLRGRKIGSGGHCQGPSVHALAITKKSGNRILL